MKKTIAWGIIFLLVVMSFTSISGNQLNYQLIKSSGGGNILYVGGSGPGNYTGIQSAIDDANNGDTIFVYNGTYYGALDIGKSNITIIGENRDTTIIDGKKYFQTVRIYANRGKLSGFTIRNCSDSGSNLRAIHLWCSYWEVSDNIIIANKKHGGMFGTHGILIGGNENIVSNNIITNCRHGIGIEGPGRILNNIFGNTFFDNVDGIYINSGTYPEKKENFITDNIFFDNRVGIYTIFKTNLYQITGNSFYNNDDGIFTEEGNSRFYISSNNFTNNKNGLYFEYGEKNILENNQISNNQIGFYCGASETIIKNNSFLYNSEIGIEIVAGENDIKNNNFIGNGNGIFIRSGRNKIIKNNFIDNGKNAGFRVFIWGAFSNKWINNYWYDYNGQGPYLILGELFSFLLFTEIPWSNVDEYPADEPNNWTTTQGCGIE